MKTLLILAAVISLSIAYDEGAPEKACLTMDPSEGHAPANSTIGPQNGTAPFETIPLEVKLDKGGQVEIWLRALNSTTFKGFMTMAFDAAYPDSNIPIGTFEGFDPEEVQTINCTGGFGNAITQTHDSYKQNVTAIWKAPDLFFGTVIFKTTFVQRKTSYWVKVPSTANVTIPMCSGSPAITSSLILWFAALALPLATLRAVN